MTTTYHACHEMQLLAKNQYLDINSYKQLVKSLNLCAHVAINGCSAEML